MSWVIICCCLNMFIDPINFRGFTFIGLCLFYAVVIYVVEKIEKNPSAPVDKDLIDLFREYKNKWSELLTNLRRTLIHERIKE